MQTGEKIAVCSWCGSIICTVSDVEKISLNGQPVPVQPRLAILTHMRKRHPVRRFLWNNVPVIGSLFFAKIEWRRVG